MAIEDVMHHAQTRRRLLRRTARIGLGALSAWALGHAADRGTSGQPDWPLQNIASARAVGRRYLETGPEPAGLHALDRALRAAPPGPWIRRRIAADFARGDVVVLDGWVLAATEARLCALAALS